MSISVGDSQIPSSPKVRDLGVLFDNCLSLDAHISNICRSTHFHLRHIGRIRTLLTFHTTAQLIHALITTRLDFCNSILYNLPNNKIERLQWIQNQAARMLTRSHRRNHITPVLRELHWLRISDRIIFKILILTHKAFHGVAPVYLCEFKGVFKGGGFRGFNPPPRNFQIFFLKSEGKEVERKRKKMRRDGRRGVNC